MTERFSGLGYRRSQVDGAGLQRPRPRRPAQRAISVADPVVSPEAHLAAREHSLIEIAQRASGPLEPSSWGAPEFFKILRLLGASRCTSHSEGRATLMATVGASWRRHIWSALGRRDGRERGGATEATVANRELLSHQDAVDTLPSPAATVRI